MKLFRKIVAAVLAAVLSFTLLTACSGGGVVTSPNNLATRTEDAYMTIFNAVFGTDLPNDPTLKNAAQAKLSLIDKDGLIKSSQSQGYLDSDNTEFYYIPRGSADSSGKASANAITKEMLLQLENPANLQNIKVSYQAVFDSLLQDCSVNKLAVAAEARGEKVYYVIAFNVTSSSSSNT